MTKPTDDACEQLKSRDGFVNAVNLSTPMAFAEMTAGLTEAERKKLSKAAQELLQQARSKERANHGWPTHEGHMARLALLAVGPRSQTGRPMNLDQRPSSLFALRAVPGPNPYEEAAVKILTDREPDWADEWLNHQITDEVRSLSWQTVRRLIREGVCRRPDSPDYLRLVARFGLSTDFDQDPELLEEAWRLFEIPSHAFDVAAYTKQGDAAKWKESRGQTWPQTFYFYAHQGRIDRGRLIDETLKALWREFTPSERAGLISFHNLLNPTEDELLGRQSAYIELLRHPAAPVVGFALTVIKSLAKAKAFDAEAALKALPAVFEVASKSQPKSALSLLKTLARDHLDLKPLAISAALRALSHAHSDIQLAAIQALRAWRDDGLPRESLAELGRSISPVVRPHLDKLLSDLGDDSVPTVENAELQAAEASVSSSELRARVGLICPGLKAAWKLHESLGALEAGEMLPPADIDASPFVLPGLSELKSIKDVEELIDVVGQALETIDSPMEIERILDGLSRFGLERPGDFIMRTDVLGQRIRDVDPQPRPKSLSMAQFILPATFRLLWDWLGIGEGVPLLWRGRILQPPTIPVVPVYQVLDLRAEYIRLKWKAQARCGPLLSFPTHEHGWIDPRVFVDRLRPLDLSELERSRPDFCVGLLRLAPDFREEAIGEAVRLPDPINRIVRYALGGEVRPTSADRNWKAEWLAAGRVRSPRGELHELEPLDLPPVANAVTPARFRVRLDRVPADSENRRYQFYVSNEPYLDVEPAFVPPSFLSAYLSHGSEPPAVDAPEYPVLVFAYHLAVGNGYFLTAWMEAWLASLWPSNTEPFLLRAVQKLLTQIDFPASSAEVIASASSMSPLLNAERGWPAMAMYALWLAMFSRDADARAVAMDALVEGLADGRAHPEPLAEILIEIAGFNWAKLNRLAEGLRQVARISSWGSLVISQILDRLIASWKLLPRDAHHILELQLELLLQINGRLSESAQRPLAASTGGGKTGKLVSQLLNLNGSNNSPAYRSALSEGIRLRIAHVETLQKASGERTHSAHAFFPNAQRLLSRNVDELMLTIEVAGAEPRRST